MNWFERLTGFQEHSYDAVQAQLEVRGTQLHSRVNGKSYAIGTLELASLTELRQRALSGGGLPGRLKVQVVRGDVRRLHQAPASLCWVNWWRSISTLPVTRTVCAVTSASSMAWPIWVRRSKKRWDKQQDKRRASPYPPSGR